MKNINDFFITQNGLRNLKALPDMIRYVRNGGIYNLETISKFSEKSVPLIAITRFEDGREAIHDGHHRVASIWLSGTRDFLYDDEYIVKEMTYDYYNELGFPVGWVTPFDPRTHVRLCDFKNFKAKAVELYKAGKVDEATKFVAENQSLYLMPRTLKHDHISGVLTMEEAKEHGIMDLMGQTAA